MCLIFAEIVFIASEGGGGLGLEFSCSNTVTLLVNFIKLKENATNCKPMVKQLSITLPVH